MSLDTEMTLSFVVPYYDGVARRHSLDSFIDFLHTETLNDNAIEIIIVTNYTDIKMHFADLKHLNINIVLIEDQDPELSLAKYRNRGVLNASNDWVMLWDIDLRLTASVLNSILSLINSDKFENAFYVLPVYYLEKDVQYDTLMLNNILSDSTSVSMYAATSSAVLLRRDYYLELGGQNEDFIGWGYEDWEFAYRLVFNFDLFPMSRNPNAFIQQGYEHLGAYTGFKAMFRTYADFTRLNNIYAMHEWHEPDSGFRKEEHISRNKTIFYERTKQFITKGHYKPVVINQFLPKAFVTNLVPSCNRQIYSSFNVVSELKQDDMSNKDKAVDYIISGIRLQDDIYESLRSLGYQVVEPFVFGISGRLHWLLNRVLENSDKLSFISCKGHKIDSVSNDMNHATKKLCLVIFNQDGETDSECAHFRELIYSAIFSVYDEFDIVWFEPGVNSKDIGSLKCIGSYIEVLDLYECQCYERKHVIHLNESLLLGSLSYQIPSVTVHSKINLFSNLNKGSVETIYDFLRMDWVVNAKDIDAVLDQSSTFILSTGNNPYDNYYTTTDANYEIKYKTLKVSNFINKTYSWSEFARANQKLSAQHLSHLTEADFKRPFVWPQHNIRLEYQMLYGIQYTDKPERKYLDILDTFNELQNADYDLVKRRYKKLKENPKRFFLDSKYSAVRRIGSLLAK